MVITLLVASGSWMASRATSSEIGLFINDAKPTTLVMAPSSSRMFEVTALAVASAQEKQAPAKPAAGQTTTAKEKADLAKQVDLFTQIASAAETEKDPLMLFGDAKPPPPPMQLREKNYPQDALLPSESRQEAALVERFA